MVEINNLNKIVQEKMLFSNVNLTIELDTKVAIVGPNGNGKTTFLNIIGKVDVPSEGVISYAKKCNIGYLRQHNKIQDEHITSEMYLRSAFTQLNELKTRLDNYEKQIEIEYSDKVMIKYNNAIEMYSNLGGYEIEAEINKICDSLKIDKRILGSRFNVLSKGQQKIIELAKILLTKPNVLLLDEPTNHLDFTKIAILENVINNFDGAVVVVTHDREFVNNTCTNIIEIKDGKFSTYNGNYDFYIKEKNIETNNLIKSFYEQKKEIARLKRLARQYRVWAQIGDNEKFYKLAKRAEKQLEEMEKIKLDKKVNENLLEFDNVNRLGDEVIIVEDLNIGYSDTVLINNVNMEIFRGEKVCIIGSNGCGKSTLINHLVKTIKESKDDFKYSDNIKLGVIEQEVKFDNENQSVYEYAKEFINKEESKIRSILHNYDFTKDMINKKLNVLSGGQRVRLKLLEQIQLKVNLLIMDEPTNHLDIVTCEQLEKSLQQYEGTSIFISHDRYFIKKIATVVYEVKENVIKLNNEVL